MKTTTYIKWLWRASYGIRSRIALSAVWGALYVCASLAFVWVSKQMVDIATSKVEGFLWFYIGLMVVCMAAQLLFSGVSSRMDALNGIRLKNGLRQHLFSRIMESSLSRKELPHTGDMLSRMEEDVRIVSETLCMAIPTVIVTLVQLVAAFGFLLILEPSLAWILISIMPVALILSKVYMMRMRHITGEIRNTESRAQSYVQEHLQHISLIRSMECTPRTISTLGDIQSELQCQVKRRADFTLFSRTIVQAGFMVGYATAFLWGVFGMIEGAVTFGMMTAFLQLVAQVQRPVVEMSRYVPSFIHSVTSVERLDKLDAVPSEQKGAAVRLDGRVGVRVEGVEFRYPDGTDNVLNGFSHDFAPGSFTALVGETGVGKSTLIKLMLALLNPDRGTLTLYNERETVNASPLTRWNIVYVPQGNTLLSGTVRENLLLGNPKASENELRDALYRAAADFVLTLPDGLDTICGESGAGLSEGQAQRIAIARALLRPGSILLLDEPTSSLDNKTELILLERLAAYSRNKTIILVTHRETAINYCNASVRVEKNL